MFIGIIWRVILSVNGLDREKIWFMSGKVYTVVKVDVTM